MDSTAPPSASGGPALMLDDDDALLFDALAFIGDLDFDVDDATPDEDEELPWSLLASGALLSPSGGLVAAALPPREENFQTPPQTESLIETPRNTVETDAYSVATPAQQQPVEIPLKQPEQQEEPASKPKSINRARTRRREELAYLRGLVGELEDRLTSLRPREDDDLQETNAAGSHESTELVDAWAQLASRQYEQRQRSELANAELKRLLQEQIQVGKSLERVLRRKRPTLESLGAGVTTEKRLRRSNSRSWNDQLVFDELLAECDALYAQTESTTARFGGTPTKPYRDIQLVHDPELGMTLQTVDHRILPFSYEDTVSVVWSSFPEISAVHRTHSYHNVDLNGDSMKLQFRVVTAIGRVRGEVAVKVAIRRYVEANRTVIITSGIIDPSEVSQINMNGVRMRQCGWRILEPMPASQTSPHGATKMLIHLRAVPDVDDDLHDQTRKVGTLTNFLLTTMSVEIESRSQKVDNRLLELSLAGGRANV